MRKWGLLSLLILCFSLLAACKSDDQTQNVAQRNTGEKAISSKSRADVEVIGKVFTEALEKSRVKTTPLKKVMVTTAVSTKVMNGPGTDKKTLGTLTKGKVVEVFEKADLEDEAWYHIHYKDEKKGWINAKDAKVPSSKRLNVALINQLPELPNGCEITSLTMLLQSAGVDVDKMTLADKMKKVPFEENGLKGDPNEGFVGNMYHGPPGYSVYHGPVAELAKKYLGDKVVDLTGDSWQKVEDQIIKGKPVWVIVNVQFKKLPDSYYQDWKTKNGTLKVTMQEHSVLVTGYDDKYIYFNDPLAGIKNRKANKKDFEAAWKQQDNQAVSYN